MLFNSPLSPEKADRLIGLLGLSPGDRVLDVGCGHGEMLVRVVESSGARGLGIDHDAEAIAAARTCAAGRIAAESYEFLLSDVDDAPLVDGSFAVAICLGATHAFGTGEAAYANALDRLTRLVRPGGRMLVGEGYWKQPPAAEYLALIGEPVGVYHDHVDNVAFAEKRGLVPLYAATSSDDEWDHFEWSHHMRIEGQSERHRNDPAIAEKLERSRQWRDGYLRWGRATMGFGYYLFLKPSYER